MSADDVYILMSSTSVSNLLQLNAILTSIFDRVYLSATNDLL